MSINLVDSYDESNADGTAQVLYLGSSKAGGQTYANPVENTLDSVKFYLKKTGSPTGNATVKIYAITGTLGTDSVPTGGALATSDVFDVATLSTSYALVTLSFSGAERITLTASTNYAISFEYSGGGATNSVSVGVDSSAPTHAGNHFAKTVFDLWVALVGSDAIFYIYGDYTPPPSSGEFFLIL